MTVQWNGSQVLTAVRKGVVTGLVRGTEAVREDATSRILSGPKTGRVYGRHQASAPGESPASDTGALVNSITTSVDQAALTGNVNFGTGYSAFLEYGTSRMAPRPYARVSVIAKRDEITADIADEVKKALA